MTEMQVGASRRFIMDDQEAFARLSGDRNPVHMSQTAARRTQAGAAVVHGVHGLLWALDTVAADRFLAGLKSISARFNRFIYLGAEAQVRLKPRESSLTVEVWADGLAVTTVKLEWGDAGAPRLGGGLFPAKDQPLDPTPEAPPFEAMAGLAGRVSLPDDGLAQAMFPHLAAALGAGAVKAFASASGVVGMACPGLHSLFSQMDLTRVADAQSNGLGWRCQRTDARARWVVLDVAGAGWEGAIICLARREPVEPPSMAGLSALVDPRAFAGRTALVVGGSRGLGAVTAKLLAAGGAKVIVTYARGLAEAQAIAAEIEAARGPGVAAILSFDVTGDVAAQLRGLPPGVTHLYYFATPHIAGQTAALYSRSTLDAFMDVYVDGFAAVWAALGAHRPLTALYPSTVFLDERPKGMTEYVMAKAAAEQLCHDLARKAPGVAITTPRLPRVLTDQTAVLPALPTASALEVMLPLLLAER